jgi:cell fate (sporulation/competence/biofilm development) regulator YmcA (YheA/YmcA/DUF963 family)
VAILIYSLANNVTSRNKDVPTVNLIQDIIVKVQNVNKLLQSVETELLQKINNVITLTKQDVLNVN